MATEVLTLKADITDLEKKLDIVDKDLKKVGADAQKTGNKIEDSFEKGGRGAKKLTSETSKISSAFKSLGGVIAATFATGQIIDFTKRAVQLAGQLQGVKAAFDQLNSPGLLNRLREATRGTVSDLELMKQAVRAENFKVPLSKLATFFEFATKRATQTGESVDYLTNSIIDGIGRKSTLVLDNLGISATELQEEIKKVGDFGTAAANIIERDLGRMGDVAETTATKTARLSASLENLQTLIGTFISPAIGDLADKIQSFVDVVDTEAVSSVEKLFFIFSKMLPISNSFAAQYAEIEARIKGANGAMAQEAEELEKINTQLDEIISKRLKELGLTDELVGVSKGIVETYKEQIKEIDNLIATTPSQERLNELTKERLDLQTRLNAALNQRNNLEAFDDGSVALDTPTPAGEIDPNLQLNIDLESDTFVEDQLRITSEAEEAWQEYYDNLLLLNAETNQQQALNTQQRIEWEENLERQKAQAIGGLAVATFSLLSTLAGQNAEQQKAFAIFEASISAFLAIQNALATGGPPPANIIAAAAIGALAAVNVAKIATTSVPNFYDGTDYLQRGNNPKGRDTIPVMAHEGEAIIPASQNAKYPGLSKAWINDDLDKYITVSHVIPALKKQQVQQEREKAALLSQTLSGSFNADLNDGRIVNRLRNQEYILEEIAKSVRRNRRINPNRA